MNIKTKTFTRTILGMLMVFVFVFPVQMLAGGDADTNGGYDSASSEGLVTCTGLNCNVCELVKTANNIVNFLIVILTIAATIMIVISGFQLVTSGGDPSQRQKAKSSFVAILIGFVIVLSAWLLVDLLLKTLTKDSKNDPKGLELWTTVQCVGITNTNVKSDNTLKATVEEEKAGLCAGATCTNGTSDTGPGSGGGYDSSSADDTTDATARSVLDNNGIGIWESAPGKTSLEGIKVATLNEVVILKNSCNCDLIVTGGTEAGFHADGQYSHENGYKIDVDDSVAVTNYITSNYSYVGVRSDKAELYQSPSGAIYAKEDSHWDVLVR